MGHVLRTSETIVFKSIVRKFQLEEIEEKRGREMRLEGVCELWWL